jgi:hypothetical protein
MHIAILRDNCQIERQELPIKYINESGIFFVEYEGSEHEVVFIPLIYPSNAIIIGGSDDRTTATREHTAETSPAIQSTQSIDISSTVQPVRQSTDIPA